MKASEIHTIVNKISERYSITIQPKRSKFEMSLVKWYGKHEFLSPKQLKGLKKKNNYHVQRGFHRIFSVNEIDI